VILLRDIAGDAATNAATKVRPSQEDLQNLDAPAADNTWHEKPDLSKDKLKGQFQNIYKGDAKEDGKAVLSEGTSAAQDRQTGTASGVNAQAGASVAVNTLQQKVDQNVDEETKEKARTRADEYKTRTKEYFGKKVPQERREQTIWRLKVCLGSTSLSPSF